MKAYRLTEITDRIIPVTLFVFVVMALGSCARKVAFQTSPVVPAAEGTVKIKKDKNNNYALSLSVRNLAEPKRLDPPRETYVVWIETENDGTKNIGRLKSSAGLFSSKLKASLSSVTSFKPVRVFITAEDNANVQYPGPQVVLRTGFF